MVTLVIRLAINAVALWAAAELVEGITLVEDFWSVVFLALIFGIVNAVIKPVIAFLSFPFILVTLGLFTLVINTLMLMLTDWLSDNISVDGFRAAFWGALVISIVSWFLSSFLDKDKEKKGKDENDD